MKALVYGGPGKVAPGSSVAIVGAGPISLDDNRLEVARRFGAARTVDRPTAR
jgi:hypothetical protein